MTRADLEPASPRNTPPVVRVVVVDDHQPFRAVARVVIGATKGFELAGTASSGQELLDLLRRSTADLALIDVRMPGMDGIDVAYRVHEAWPETIVALISIDPPEQIVEARSLPAATRLLRKQDFGSHALRELWSARGA